MANTKAKDLLVAVRNRSVPDEFVGTPMLDTFSLLCQITQGMSDSDVISVINRLVGS